MESVNSLSSKQFLSGGGEMGRLIRTKDWSKTSLGSIDIWPQSLRTIVSVCLNSRFPMLVCWGRDRVNIYNDSLRHMLAEEKHSVALGSAGISFWTELRDIVMPSLESIFHEGKATWSQHELLLLHRHGHTEEHYFTFSYSPIYDESGTIGGAFTAITDTSAEVISARHLHTLRDLASNGAISHHEKDIYCHAFQVIRMNDKDFPFALLFQVEDGGRRVSGGGKSHEDLNIDTISFEDNDPDPWNIKEVIDSNKQCILDDLSGFGDLPRGAWQVPPNKAMVLPISQNDSSLPFAVLVVGLNPHRSPNENDLEFYHLFGGQIARQITNFRVGALKHAGVAPRYAGSEIVRASRLLIVGDNPDVLDNVKKILHNSFIVDTAANGRIALDKIRKTRPDLVISDTMMPVMSGIELVSAIKENPYTLNLPVILLSASGEEESSIERRETDADDYLIKPFSAKELMARVNSHLKLSQSRKAAEQFVNEIFEQAPVPICILKGAGLVIERANPFMLTLWGQAADEVLNKPIESVFPEFVDLGIISQLKKVFQNGEQYRAEEIPLDMRRDGKTERRYVSFVFKPLRNSVLDVTSVVVVGYDVTNLYLAKIGAQQDADAFERIVTERTSTLQNMNQELLMKNGELEQFTFLASHDLQEPLRKIQVFAGLIMHQMHMPDAVEKYVSKMVASVSRMSALIQSLLDYSNISRSDYVSVQVDLNKVLELVREDLELLILEKGCHIDAEVLPVIPGNPRQLGQLFYNLIHNAIKFCDRQPPVIEITWHSVGADEKQMAGLQSHADYICIDFVDNGIGFDPRYADRIFEIFRRMHDQLEYPGTGIGLALCKKIVESHHGAISAESTRSDGSKFHVYLPA